MIFDEPKRCCPNKLSCEWISEICFSKLAPAFDLNSCFLHQNWINYLKKLNKKTNLFRLRCRLSAFLQDTNLECSRLLHYLSFQIVSYRLFSVLFFSKRYFYTVFYDSYCMFHTVCVKLYDILYMDIISCTHHWRQMKNSCIGKPSFHWFSGTELRLARKIHSYFWMKDLK